MEPATPPPTTAMVRRRLSSIAIPVSPEAHRTGWIYHINKIVSRSHGCATPRATAKGNDVMRRAACFAFMIAFLAAGAAVAQQGGDQGNGGKGSGDSGGEQPFGGNVFR